MTVLVPPEITGAAITPNLFGGNFLANRYALGREDGIEAAVEALGVTGLRFPGGTVTERLFDIADPDRPVAVNAEGVPVQMVPLSDFLAYAEGAGQPVTIVLPTRAGLSEARDTNGDRFPEFDEALLRSFVRDVATGEYGSAEIAAFEIGNEYWSSGEMTSVEYGRLASGMARIVDGELDAVAGRTGDDPGIDVIVQTGTNFGSAGLQDGYEGLETEAILADLSERYGVRFGEEATLAGGNPNWRAINDALVRNAFDDAEMESIDGVVTHLYSQDPGQPGQRAFGLEQINASWIADDPDLELWVTEWNQAADGRGFDADADFGLAKAAEILDIFETMVGAGVDQAHVWPLLHNTRNALKPDALDGDPSPSGSLFAMMSDALPGKRMLDFAVDDDDVTEFQGRTADVHGFYGEGEMVLYVVSTSARTETLTFDLDGMIESGGTVTGTVLGVRAGDLPGSTRARAETEDLPPEEFYDDGLVAIALDPGEILELRIAGFTPTDAFVEAIDPGGDGPDGDPDLTPGPLTDLPTVPFVDEEDEEEEDADDGDDGSMLDGIALLLGLLPLLALAGMGG